MRAQFARYFANELRAPPKMNYYELLDIYLYLMWIRIGIRYRGIATNLLFSVVSFDVVKSLDLPSTSEH